MKTNMFTAALLATAASASLQKVAEIDGVDLKELQNKPIDMNVAVAIPPQCKICDGFSGPCIAACIAGFLADPLCDACAGVGLASCLAVSFSFPRSSNWI